MVKRIQLTETEAYYQRALKAKEDLLAVLRSSDNMNEAFIFIAQALTHALTDANYEDEEARRKLQDQYFSLKFILDNCLELKESEGMVALLEKAKAK